MVSGMAEEKSWQERSRPNRPGWCLLPQDVRNAPVPGSMVSGIAEIKRWRPNRPGWFLLPQDVNETPVPGSMVSGIAEIKEMAAEPAEVVLAAARFERDARAGLDGERYCG